MQKYKTNLSLFTLFLLLTTSNNLFSMHTEHREQEETCSICRENFENKDNLLTECGHKFHPKCLFKWAKIKAECPICRYTLLNYNQSPERFLYSYNEQNLIRLLFLKDNILKKFKNDPIIKANPNKKIISIKNSPVSKLISVIYQNNELDLFSQKAFKLNKKIIKLNPSKKVKEIKAINKIQSFKKRSKCKFLIVQYTDNTSGLFWINNQKKITKKTKRRVKRIKRVGKSFKPEKKYSSKFSNLLQKFQNNPPRLGVH